jgi:hypothetical protein
VTARLQQPREPLLLPRHCSIHTLPPRLLLPPLLLLLLLHGPGCAVASPAVCRCRRRRCMQALVVVPVRRA